MFFRISLLFILLLITAWASANPLKWPTVKGPDIYDHHGKKMVLKGVMIPDPEHLNTKKWGAKVIGSAWVIKKAILEYKAQVIRLPVLPTSDGHTGFFRNPEEYLKKHLDPAVKLINRLGAYAIIDLHYVGTYLDKKKEVLKFWRVIAPHYRHNPQVIFEIFNEPTTPDHWQTWKQNIVLPTVKTIRQVAPHNLIIVGAPYWSSHLKGILTAPVRLKNIIYAAHIYPNQLKQSDWNHIYEQVLKRYPLFITEWGYKGKAHDPVIRGTTNTFGKVMTRWMQKHRLSFTATIFDFKWQPAMFNQEWSLTRGENGMGELVYRLLQSP